MVVKILTASYNFYLLKANTQKDLSAIKSPESRTKVVSLRHESNSSFPNHLSYENYLLFVSIILIEYSLLGYSLCSPSRNVKTKQFSLTKLKAAAVFLPGNSSSDETAEAIRQERLRNQEKPSCSLRLGVRGVPSPLPSGLGNACNAGAYFRRKCVVRDPLRTPPRAPRCLFPLLRTPHGRELYHLN